MSTKVAINGFGRIGRNVLKNILSKYGDNLEIVAINDLSDAKTLAHLLKYDSVYRKYEKTVTHSGDKIEIKDNERSSVIKILAEKDPENLPWEAMEVDTVLECTGLFTDRENAEKHLRAGARRVIISAPSKDPEKIPSFVLGVNEEKFDPETQKIVDMGSCTTNCLAPIVKIINDNYGLQTGMMTTVHSYTISQNILDGSHKDLRRSRAGAINIIPTTTGAAKAVGRVIPEVEGKITGMAMRVPTPTVSIVDFVCTVEKQVKKEDVLWLIEKESQKENLKEILRLEKEPLVSSDYIGSSYSCVVDGEMIEVKDNLIKILSWYDNEWGYSSRLADFAAYINK